MKIYLAGENGKEKILGLYADIYSKWSNKSSALSGRIEVRQTDRQMNVYLAGGLTGNLSPFYQRIASKQASKQVNERVFLAGEGYHQSEEFLNEAKEKMRVFLAGEGYHPNEKFLNDANLFNAATNFQDFNILESYYSLRENEQFLSLLKRCNSFIIDSGAFTFMQGTHKEDIDWDAYIEEYADCINRWDIRLFFELDIDSIVGLSEVERLRSKLEKLTNKQPIPVWHKTRGKNYFIRMCEQYPYVSIGGIVTKEIPRQLYEKGFPWFIQTAHYHGCKIHGLGYTNILGLHKYHFDSVDSTAWLYGNRGGYLYKFRSNGTMEQIKPGDKGRLKPRISALNNFIEWIKFSKYAEKKL